MPFKYCYGFGFMKYPIYITTYRDELTNMRIVIVGLLFCAIFIGFGRV